MSSTHTDGLPHYRIVEDTKTGGFDVTTPDGRGCGWFSGRSEAHKFALALNLARSETYSEMYAERAELRAQLEAAVTACEAWDKHLRKLDEADDINGDDRLKEMRNRVNRERIELTRTALAKARGHQ